MRVTVCELPHEPRALHDAWAGLVAHVAAEESELVVLPELVAAAPFWEREPFDAAIYAEGEQVTSHFLTRLGELDVAHVVGTRPITVDGARFNEGFLAPRGASITPLRRKHWLPDEPGGYEARWFDRGPPDCPTYHAGELGFALVICSELWALEWHRRFAAMDLAAIVAPRATAAATTEKWLALGTVSSVAAGCYGLSSNRVSEDGACGGVGWIIDPDGALLARTSARAPYQTRDLDLEETRRARGTYPRSVFSR